MKRPKKKLKAKQRRSWYRPKKNFLDDASAGALGVTDVSDSQGQKRGRPSSEELAQAALPPTGLGSLARLARMEIHNDDVKRYHQHAEENWNDHDRRYEETPITSDITKHFGLRLLTVSGRTCLEEPFTEDVHFE